MVLPSNLSFILINFAANGLTRKLPSRGKCFLSPFVKANWAIASLGLKNIILAKQVGCWLLNSDILSINKYSMLLLLWLGFLIVVLFWSSELKKNLPRKHLSSLNNATYSLKKQWFFFYVSFLEKNFSFIFHFRNRNINNKTRIEENDLLLPLKLIRVFP